MGAITDTTWKGFDRPIKHVVTGNAVHNFYHHLLKIQEFCYAFVLNLGNHLVCIILSTIHKLNRKTV